MHKETFDVFCSTCNIMVEAKVIACGCGEYSSDAMDSFDNVDTPYQVNHYSVALCRRCNSPFLVKESLYGVPGEFESVTDETVLYPVAPGTNLDGLPDVVARSVTQAHRSYITSSYDACALMCRRALEALCQTLSSKGKDLAQRLANLKNNEHIDARLLDWAHEIRLVGNEAAHEVDKAVSKEDARDILEFTEALLMYVFTFNTKFRTFESRRKKCTTKSVMESPQQGDTNDSDSHGKC